MHSRTGCLSRSMLREVAICRCQLRCFFGRGGNKGGEASPILASFLVLAPFVFGRGLLCLWDEVFWLGRCFSSRAGEPSCLLALFIAVLFNFTRAIFLTRSGPPSWLAPTIAANRSHANRSHRLRGVMKPRNRRHVLLPLVLASGLAFLGPPPVGKPSGRVASQAPEAG